MSRSCSSWLVASLSAWLVVLGTRASDSPAAFPPGASRAATILEDHDRALVKDLVAYLSESPKAEDAEEAYALIFNRTIEHDWFAAYEGLAHRFLDEWPDSSARPLAHIIATMARARAGEYGVALESYRALVKDLNDEEQAPLAESFADNLAGAATQAGEFRVAREVYQALLRKYGSSDDLRQKVGSELARLDRIGQPAPRVDVLRLDGQPVRLADFRGKYLLLDFWASWCAPCVAELPGLRAAYDRFHGKGFEVVGVSLDETAAPLSRFLAEHRLPWPQVHNATCGSDLVASWSVGRIPASYLIAPDGTIVRLDLRGEALVRFLQDMLK